MIYRVNYLPENKNAKFATVSGQSNNPTNPEVLYRKCCFTGSDVWHVLRKRYTDGYMDYTLDDSGRSSKTPSEFT